jgi:hypothetical protein
MPVDPSQHTTGAVRASNPFRSFWMAGFECSDQLNASGERVDLLEMSGHQELVRTDYARILPLGIKTVREGIRWSQVEYRPYQYDFTYVRDLIEAGRDCGVQQIWDLCHFGYPADLSPLHPKFTARFTALCEAFVDFYKDVLPNETLIVTPVNEVSFISWLGGEVAGTTPYCLRMGFEVKYHLMKAYIAGVKAMKRIRPDIRIMTTEPLVNMVPEIDPETGEMGDASAANELQFQSVDMLCGRICPELGGSEDLLDILGLNYYYNNQWIVGSFEFLGWNDPVPDPRWKPLSGLIRMAQLRYGKPVVLAETSHPGIDRPLWVQMIASQCAALIREGIPLWGVCLYPIIDRPDWDDLNVWHHSGLWDTDTSLGKYGRILHQPYEVALREGQKTVEEARGTAYSAEVFQSGAMEWKEI